MIYLAAPYTHDNPLIQAQRAAIITRVAAAIAATDRPVFSPITHGVALVEHLPIELVRDHAFWMRQCMAMLIKADVLLVLMMPGWTSSRGVQAEIAHARKTGAMPVNYCTVEDWLGAAGVELERRLLWAENITDGRNAAHAAVDAAAHIATDQALH
jgi:hypothetical protein